MENKKEEKKPDIQQETAKFLEKKVIAMNAQNQLFYKYNPQKGYHEELTENQLQREVDSYLNSGDTELEWTLATINRVIDTAKIKAKAFNDFDSDPDCIVLTNGVLDTKTKELHKFTPNLHATAGLSFPYQPDATCPKYEKFKSDVCCGNSDMMQDLDSILGLALVGDTKAAKGILLAGTGSNGKSTFLSLLSEFIPEKYITNMSISAINSKRDFDRHALASSRINILHELDKKPTLDGMFSNNVKALITGDDLSAEIKGGIRYNFKPHTILLFAANRLPKIERYPDKATIRRYLVLRFHREFTDSEVDLDMLEKLKAELPGILNCALSGLDAIRKRNYRFLSQQASDDFIIKEAREKFPLNAFVEDVFVADPNATISNREIESAYRIWCSREGVSCESMDAGFSRRLTNVIKERYIGVECKKSEHGGKRGKTGLSIKPEFRECVKAIS